MSKKKYMASQNQSYGVKILTISLSISITLNKLLKLAVLSYHICEIELIKMPGT